MKKLALITLLFLFLLIPNIQATNYYVIDLWNSDTSASPMNVYLPPAYAESGTSQVTLNPYANVSISTDIITTYKSPYDVTLAISSPPTTNGNIACLDLGGSTTGSKGNNGTHEINYKVTYDGNVNTFYGSYDYQVSSEADTIKISNRIEDTLNFKPFTYYYHECDTAPFDVPFYDKFDNTNYGLCKPMETLPMVKAIGKNCIVSNSLFQYYFPFNSSNGFITYDLRANNTNCNAPARWRLYPLSNSSDITTLCDTDVCNGNITLSKNTIYVLTQYWDFCAGSSLTFYPPEINLTIGIFQGDYVCGEYTECVDNYRHRTCVDQAGKLPDEIEYQTCSIVEIEGLTMGFEEYYFDTIKFCGPSWAFGCVYNSDDRIVTKPINWSIVEPAVNKPYFIEMTQEWATEGTRSLKMWYDPPREGSLNVATNVCENATQGRVPVIYKGVNDSYFISKNITFPATNMLLSYDIVTCPETPLHHGKIEGLFGVELCPKRCFGNCSQHPRGKYLFDLIDLDTFGTVAGFDSYFDEASIFPKSKSFDLSNLDLEVNKTYNIYFAVWVENYNDMNSYCVMIDNVRYSVIEESLTCESKCIGTTYTKANYLNETCVFTEILNSPICLTSDDPNIEYIQNCEPYCDENNNYYIPADNCIADEFIIYEDPIPNFALCLLDDEEEQEQDDLFEQINITEIAETGELPNWANTLLFTPVMWIIIISIIAGGLITKLTDSWEFGLIGFFAFMIGLGLLFPVTFAWITIILILVGGFIFAGLVLRSRG